MYSLIFLSSVLGASALSLPRSAASCPFTLTATGGQTGTIGSLGDGQTRIGGGLASTTFTINSDNGTVTDDAGRACILTPSVDQFQCDLNGIPTTGFAINSNGSFTASGSSVFYACPASDSEWNLYTQPVLNQAKCVEVGLMASSCYSAVSSSSAIASTSAAASSVAVASSTAPSVVTVTAATPAPSTVTVTVSNCGAAPSAPAAVESSAPAVPVAAASSVPAVAASSAPAAPVAAASSTPAVVVVSSAPASVAPTTLITSTQPAAPAKTSPAFTYSWANFTTSAVVSTAIPSATESASSCVATSLTGSSTSGNYQYPHLIVPVSSTSPNTAYGTQYFATISSDTSTIFNFDVPSSYAGKTCNLIFLLPEHDQLETSSYTSSGNGEIDFKQLSGVASSSTTYNNQPSVAKDLGDFDITVGSSTLVESFACPAGETVSYELSAVGDTYLHLFQDWNPSPLGLYITYC